MWLRGLGFRASSPVILSTEFLVPRLCVLYWKSIIVYISFSPPPWFIVIHWDCVTLMCHVINSHHLFFVVPSFLFAPQVNFLSLQLWIFCHVSTLLCSGCSHQFDMKWSTVGDIAYCTFCILMYSDVLLAGAILSFSSVTSNAFPKLRANVFYVYFVQQKLLWGWSSQKSRLNLNSLFYFHPSDCDAL